jgi:hypothetical protein
VSGSSVGRERRSDTAEGGGSIPPRTTTRRRGRTVMQLGANEPPRHTRLGVRVPPPPRRHPHGGRGVTATQWSVTPQLMGSTPSDRPKALVAQWIAHRFPEPAVAGSSPAKGTPAMPQAPVAQRIECQSTKLEVGVRFSPGVLEYESPRSSTGQSPGFLNRTYAGSNPAVGSSRHSGRREHGWWVRHAYNVRVAGSIPARRTMFHHGRISSTGKSTCLVNRARGFESCIRLNTTREGSAAAAKRP